MDTYALFRETLNSVALFNPLTTDEEEHLFLKLFTAGQRIDAALSQPHSSARLHSFYDEINDLLTIINCRQLIRQNITAGHYHS